MNLGVIFDMDGVLVDSSAAHFEAFQEMGRRLGVAFTWDFFQKAFGLHNDEIFPLWLGSGTTHDRVAQLALEKETLYRKLAPRHVHPVTGVLELIDALDREGFRLAVGSSGPRDNVEMALDVIGRRQIFGTTVSGDDVARGKPAPDIFLKAASNLGLVPKQCLVIEDALAGIQAAQRAGMKVVAIATSLPLEKLAHATLAISSFRELNPAIVRQLLAD